MEQKKRKEDFPGVNPDGTLMTEEDRAAKDDKATPWAPPPRRHDDQ
jgi:hypothetical protein